MRFFSHSDESTDTHDTADEARKTAEVAMDYLRDESADGWDEDAAMRVCWGVILGSGKRTVYRTIEELEAAGEKEEAEHLRANGWDFLADYAVVQDIDPRDEEIAAMRARVAELDIALRAWEHLAEQDTSTADYLTAHTILTDGLAPHAGAENLADLARRALAERDAARLDGVKAGLAAAAAECERTGMDWDGRSTKADVADECATAVSLLDPAAIAKEKP